MNKFICFLLSAVFLLPGIGFAATSGPPSAPLARFTCSGSSCTGVPNDSSNTYFATISSQTAGLALDATIQSVLATLQAPLTFNLPTGASTSALQTTGNGYLLTLSTFTTSASTSALQSTGNGFLSTLATASASQATGAKQDTGNASAATTASNTGATATNTGAISTATGTTADSAYSGSGSSSIIAALKGIYARLAGTLTVSGTVSTAGSTSTPAAPDISTITTGGTAVNAFSAGHCSRGCLLVNPKGATIDLCVNGTGSTASGTTTAGALICIPPSQQFYFTARTTAISAVSSDSTHPFGGEGYQ